MHVVITGGSGFLGRYFCEQLLGAGHSLTMLDLVAPTWDSGQARFVQGDIRNPASVRAALHGCDAVLHLAAAHHDFGIAPETYFSVNEFGSAVLCRAMDELVVRKLCFLSSVAVYGHAPEPHDESAPTHPISPYGQSKLAAEVVFRRWTAKGDGRSALVMRPTITFGPRNFANMYSLIRQIHSGLYLSVGHGGNVKSLAYVENLVAATLTLWEHNHRPAFDVFNYADKPDMTSRQISDAIHRALGRKPRRLRVPLPVARLLSVPFDLATALTGKNLPISTSRINKLASQQTKFEAAKVYAVGFRPTVSLTDGITRTVAWFLRDGRARRPVSYAHPRESGGQVNVPPASSGD